MRYLLLLILLWCTPAMAGMTVNPSTGNLDVIPTVTEEDGSPIAYSCTTLKFANGDVTDNGDGTCSIADQSGAGSGDNVTVNSTAIDTTANFKDTAHISWAIVDGGAGGPDDVQASVVADSLDFTEFKDTMALDANTTIGTGASLLTFQCNNPGSNCFEFNGTGAYTGDLVHIHQHTGNVGAGSLLYLEAEDMDVDPLETIHQDAADITNDTVMLKIDAVDDDDANFIPLEIRDDSDVNNDLLFKIDYTGQILSDSLTASTILGSDASKNIVSLATATYPSLAELAYVKGVTSAIQTQINGKQATVTEGSLADSVIVSADIKDGTVAYADMVANIPGLPRQTCVSLFDANGLGITTNSVIPLFTAEGALTVTNVTVTTSSASYNIAGDLKYADARIGLANATVINAFDTASGVLDDSTITSGSVASGKFLYLVFDSAPDSSDTDDSICFMWDYD